MNTNRLCFLLIALMLPAYVFASPGAHGPNGEHLTKSSNNMAKNIGTQADGSVLMPMKNQALLGIETQYVFKSTTSKFIRLNAIVKPHPDGYAKIQSSSDGRFNASESQNLISGKTISVEDTLGYIQYQDTAFELASQTSELIAITNRINQTQRDVARLKKLGDLASKQALEQLETELLSLKQQATTLQTGLEKPEALIAPISGLLISHHISHGQWVKSGQTLFEIIAQNQYLIEATLLNNRYAGAITTAKIDSAPELKLNYIGTSPLLSNGLVQINFELSSDKASNLFINQAVTLHAPINEKQTGIILPENAVVLSRNNLPQVWIKLSAERFLPQFIKYEMLGPGFVIVTDGLGADNRVVIKGASILNQVR